VKVIMACAWMLTAVATRIDAATVEAIAQNGRIGVAITQLEFPDTLSRDLTSGFENRMLFRVSLRSRSEVLTRADVLIAVKYDLWEEAYTVARAVDGRSTDKRVIMQLAELINEFSRLRLDRLFEISALPKERDLIIQVDALINPVDRERMERLREWVAANSAPNSAVGRGATFTPKPNELFNRIFDQYTRGDDVVAPWKLTIVSRPFQIGRLSQESPDR